MIVILFYSSRGGNMIVILYYSRRGGYDRNHILQQKGDMIVILDSS